LIAGTPWLDVFCPGCGTSRAIDLRTVDRHPLASVGTLALGLRCSWCPGSAPMPKLPGFAWMGWVLGGAIFDPTDVEHRTVEVHLIPSQVADLRRSKSVPIGQ
jgi:hypothetical protein